MMRFSWKKFGSHFSQMTKSLYFWIFASLTVVFIIWIWHITSLPSATVVKVEKVFTVSYADSVHWLDTLPQEDRDDQIRDWAVWGLVGILDLDVTTLRDGTYDRPPIRDASLTDVVANPIGPGRAILDNTDTLHLIVPQHDPYLARSIGMTLDNFRKDSGEDPKQVVLYRYQIDYQRREVELNQYTPQSTEAVRQQYGYVEMTVKALSDLQNFLQQTQHLSQIKYIEGQIVVAGWRWPGAPNVPITVEDITALQRGYRAVQKDSLTAAKCETVKSVNSELRTPIDTEFLKSLYPDCYQNPAETTVAEPGFSLDPGKSLSIRELLPILIHSGIYAILKDKANDIEKISTFLEDWVTAQTRTQVDEFVKKHEELIDEILAHNNEPYLNDVLCKKEEVDRYIRCFEDALRNPIQPWLLLFDALSGESPYQFARYDGGIEGTEAGYTFFYTDLVAKGWLTVDQGTGNPSHLGIGFISSPDANIPEGLCSTEPISGRLWFDLGNERVSILNDEVNFGSIVTRVFSKMNNPHTSSAVVNTETDEVPSNYMHGHGIWWWDRHYLSIADYEPQYQRLDQLMRWGAGIAWLVNRELPLLPEVEVSLP